MNEKSPSLFVKTHWKSTIIHIGRDSGDNGFRVITKPVHSLEDIPQLNRRATHPGIRWKSIPIPGHRMPEKGVVHSEPHSNTENDHADHARTSNSVKDIQRLFSRLMRTILEE